MIYPRVEFLRWSDNGTECVEIILREGYAKENRLVLENIKLIECSLDRYIKFEIKPETYCKLKSLTRFFIYNGFYDYKKKKKTIQEFANEWNGYYKNDIYKFIEQVIEPFKITYNTYEVKCLFD